MRAAQSPTRGTARGAVHVTEVEVPLFADTPVTAAELAIHVVDEGPLLPVLEENSHDAGSTRDDRGHDFDHGADTPLFIGRVLHAITEAQEESFLSVEHVVTDETSSYPIDGENATGIARSAILP